MEEVVKTSYEVAIDMIESKVVGPDPDAPSCNEYRLRPSEEAALIMNKLLNPPPPWGLKINLSRAFLGPAKCIHIGKKLMLNSNVTYLDLSFCDMQGDACVRFFTSLEQNKSLRHLNINNNYVGDEGAIASAPSIARLETLHMSSNDITDEGAQVIAEALKTSPKIKTLSLRNNRITALGLFHLMASLEPTENFMASVPPNIVAIVQQSQNLEEKTPDETTAMTSLAEQPKTDDAVEVKEEVTADPEVAEENAAADELVDGEQPASAEVAEEEATEKVEPILNEKLHTLWVQCNDGLPDDMLRSLITILAKRYPEPVVAKKKKRKGKKAG